MKKYQFLIEKKENYLLDILTKDQRRMRYKFESPTAHARMNDAMNRLIEITKQRDLFAFDYAIKIKENDPNDNQFINEQKVIEITMKEYERMGVNSPQGQALFKKLEMDDKTRISKRIDLPQKIYIPIGLGPEDHINCAAARTNGRFPTMTYFNK